MLTYINIEGDGLAIQYLTLNSGKVESISIQIEEMRNRELTTIRTWENKESHHRLILYQLFIKSVLSLLLAVSKPRIPSTAAIP